MKFVNFFKMYRQKSHARMLTVAAAAGLIAGILLTAVFAYAAFSIKAADQDDELKKLSKKNKTLQEQLDKQNAVYNNTKTLSGDATAWDLILVNEDHPLDASYVPENLTEVAPGYSVDGRIAADLKQMLSDGAAQGLNMYVTSAYRSYDQQVDTFNASMQNRLNQGMKPLEAYQETSIQVALPGTSEHATGLAVDIISNQYSGLDERQGDTQEQQWLMQHCWEYGFILRYPSEKSDITGIIYEPWHYRYVGKDVAKEITEEGITLEEYLSR